MQSLSYIHIASTQLKTYRRNGVNTLQKVAWIEMTVSFAALLAVLALYPWMGEAAIGAFGLLGLLGICPVFLLNRKNKVLSDERDRQIEIGSKTFGFGTAWLFLALSLLAVAMWYTWSSQAIPAEFVFALAWSSFALCYGAKGAYALACYRSGQVAT